jgi:transcriptional regulator of arginine metabolism
MQWAIFNASAVVSYTHPMQSKEYRQRRIQEIVSKEFIATQGELVERLLSENFNVTQATVSRDITELRLVRLPFGKNKYRYALAPFHLASDPTEELRVQFRQFVRDIDRAENLVVLKVTDGYATGVALTLDQLSRDDIVGTLAGQDTIFVAARSTSAAKALLLEFEGYLTS